MAENSDSTAFVFPKLNKFNYAPWKQDMKVLLMDRGCWEFITGQTVPFAKDAPERDKRNYEWRKQRTYTTIYQGLEQKYFTLIANTTDGKKAWEILKENFEPTSRARLANLVDEFFEIRFNPEEETIGIFCKTVHEKKLQIEETGFKIPELLVCFQLIRRLPSDYDNLVQILYRLEDKEFSFSNVEKQLIIESGRIKLKQKDENESLALTPVNDTFLTKERMNPGKIQLPLHIFVIIRIISKISKIFHLHTH